MHKQLDRNQLGQSVMQVIGGITAAFLVICLVVWGVMFMGGWKSVPPDKIMLHYTGGPIQGTHFKGVVDPGTHTKFYGLLDNYYFLPATQRTYIISKDPNQGDLHQADFLAAPSNDNVQFTFEAAVYFKLNTDPKVIRQFMEQICFHDHCNDLSPGGGWDKMLAQYFRPQIDNAVRLAVESYDREQLYRDPNVLLKIQKTVGLGLKERINQVLGGEFFCGPDSSVHNCTDFSFVLKNPTPPDSTVQAYADAAAASQQVVTAEQNARAKEAAAQGDATSQRIRASAPIVPQEAVDYIRAQAMQACAASPTCHLTIVSGLPNAVVQTGP